MNGGETSARIASSEIKRLPRISKRDMQNAMMEPRTREPARPPKPTIRVLTKAVRKRGVGEEALVVGEGEAARRVVEAGEQHGAQREDEQETRISQRQAG